MLNENSMKYALLFGGGAIRGAAHVGALKALKKIGIETDLLCGSSVGSIIAALLAVGYTNEELEQIFLDVNFELFRDISFGFYQKFAISKGDVFLEWFRELIEKKYYGDKYEKGKNEPVFFKNIDNNLIIITTDLKTFKCEEFSTFCTPDFEVAMAVRISCCMPGLMRAVNIDDKLLVDGDLMKGKPMWSLSDNLKNYEGRILEIRLEGTFTGTDQNPLEYVNGMYSCMTYSETSFIQNTFKNYDKYDYLVINTGDTIVVDFNCSTEKRKEIIESGYKQTINYFLNSLITKKQRLLVMYKNIFEILNRTQNFLVLKKYSQAKNNFTNLFILLSDTDLVIDNNIQFYLMDFQKQIFSGIKHGLLGRSVCICPNELIDKIDKIISCVQCKIIDLESFTKNKGQDLVLEDYNQLVER